MHDKITRLGQGTSIGKDTANLARPAHGVMCTCAVSHAPLARRLTKLLCSVCSVRNMLHSYSLINQGDKKQTQRRLIADRKGRPELVVACLHSTAS